MARGLIRSALVARRYVLRPAGVWLVALVVAVALTSGTAFLPMHVGLIAMICALGACQLVAETGAVRGAVDGSWPAVSVRTGGALVLASLACGVVAGFRSADGTSLDRVVIGLPLITAALAACVLGLAACTTPGALGAGSMTRCVGLGVGASVVWLAAEAVHAPLPASSGTALAVLAVAVCAAAIAGAPHGRPARAGLCTCFTGALSIFAVAREAFATGPPSWIPSDSAGLTAAARLAQSRSEAVDAYLPVLLVGVVAAVALLVLAVRERRAAPYPPFARPSCAGSGA